MAPGPKSDWKKTPWKILRNPALQVLAGIALVLIAAWIVVETDSMQRNRAFPAPVVYR